MTTTNQHDSIDSAALADSLARLESGFPDVPRDVIAGLLGDSYLTVVNVAGEPLVDEAERLATLRLEVRTRHASLRGHR